jgi:hypothetical protein
MTTSARSAEFTGALNESQHRPLTSSDYRTLGLSALGGTLEFYDFVIYVFFAAVVGKLFFPADMPEWLRMLQTFASSPLVTWRVRWAASSSPTTAT